MPLNVQHIRALRQRHGLSQEAVAHRCGVTTQTIRRIESGTVDPRIGTVQRLCAVLRCSVTAVCADDDRKRR